MNDVVWEITAESRIIVCVVRFLVDGLREQMELV